MFSTQIRFRNTEGLTLVSCPYWSMNQKENVLKTNKNDLKSVKCETNKIESKITKCSVKTWDEIN